MTKPVSEIAFLARALEAPRIAARAEVLAKRAAEESRDHQSYLAAVLAEEVSARETLGGEHRVKAARFPQVKTLDDFDFSFQRSLKRATMAHLAQLDFLAEAKNVVFLGPSGDRQDQSVDRHRGPRGAAGTSRRLRLGPGLGRSPGRRQAGRTARRGARAPAPGAARHRRRGGLHPLRPRCGGAVLRPHLIALRTGQSHRELQQDLLQSAQVPANLCKVVPYGHGLVIGGR
jgi:hypothetical protein